MKKFRLLMVIVCAAVMLCGCGDERAILNYEQPIEDCLIAAEHSDTEGYLKCFTAEAERVYRESDGFNKDVAEDILKAEGGAYEEIDFLTNANTELGEDELEELEAQYKSEYKKVITIKKGQRLEVGFTAERDDESFSCDKEIIVVKIDDSWLIFGDVITELDFTAE